MQTLFRGNTSLPSRSGPKEIDTLLDVSYELKSSSPSTGRRLSAQQDCVPHVLSTVHTTRIHGGRNNPLGGHAHFLDTSNMQIAHGEVPKDTPHPSRMGTHRVPELLLKEATPTSGRWPMVSRAHHQHAGRPVSPPAGSPTSYHQRRGKEHPGLKVSVIWAYATTHKKPISVPLTQPSSSPGRMEVTLAYPKATKCPTGHRAGEEERP